MQPSMHKQPKTVYKIMCRRKKGKNIMPNRLIKAQHEYFNTTRIGIDIVCGSLSDKRINWEIAILVA